MGNELIAYIAAGLAAILTSIGNMIINKRRAVLDAVVKDTHNARENSLAEIRVLFDEAQRQRDVLQAEIADSRQQLNELYTSNTEYRIENARLKMEIEQAKQEINELRQKLALLDKQCNQLLTRTESITLEKK